MVHKKLPTVWPIEPHTVAKHQILEEYLKAWFPIIASWADTIVYLDGFAGPGKYKNGEDGSPIIALRTAVEHTMKYTPNITFGFIENDKKRSKALKQTLKEKFENIPNNMTYHVIDSDFEKSVNDILNELEEKDQTLAPTFAFIDPFGYSDFPMTLVKRLLDNDKCEVLITFMTGFVNRFLDPVHEDAVTKLYGSKEFCDAKNITKTYDRINFLLELYEKKLKENNSVKYVRSFEMVGKDNTVVYHLIFGTKHWKGLEVIKKAMLKVDSRGMYSFSDRIGFAQTFFVNIKEGTEWMSDAAELIFRRFRGQSVNINEIHKFVITDTRYLFKKEILKLLEQKPFSRIQSVSNRKIKTLSYPAGSVIQFSQ